MAKAALCQVATAYYAMYHVTSIDLHRVWRREHNSAKSHESRLCMDATAYITHSRTRLLPTHDSLRRFLARHRQRTHKGHARSNQLLKGPVERRTQGLDVLVELNGG